MNLMRINGSVYNLSHYAKTTFKNNTLMFWTASDGLDVVCVAIESGPEALAAWEWLQKACIWKMEPVTS